MINKTEWNRMMEGKLYNPYKVGDHSFENVHAAQKKFNVTLQEFPHPLQVVG